MSKALAASPCSLSIYISGPLIALSTRYTNRKKCSLHDRAPVTESVLDISVYDDCKINIQLVYPKNQKGFPVAYVRGVLNAPVSVKVSPSLHRQCRGVFYSWMAGRVSGWACVSIIVCRDPGADILITWPEHRPLIGWGRSRDLNTSLWLVEADHVTWTLASDWLRQITWHEHGPLIGRDRSRDMNTSLWLVEADHVTLGLLHGGADGSSIIMRLRFTAGKTQLSSGQGWPHYNFVSWLKIY